MNFQRSKVRARRAGPFKGPRQCFLGGTPFDPTRRLRPLTHISTTKTSPAAIPNLSSATPEALGSPIYPGPAKTHCLRPYFSTLPATHTQPLSTSKNAAEAILTPEQPAPQRRYKTHETPGDAGPAKTHCLRPCFSTRPTPHSQPLSSSKFPAEATPILP